MEAAAGHAPAAVDAADAVASCPGMVLCQGTNTGRPISWMIGYMICTAVACTRPHCCTGPHSAARCSLRRALLLWLHIPLAELARAAFLARRCNSSPRSGGAGRAAANGAKARAGRALVPMACLCRDPREQDVHNCCSTSHRVPEHACCRSGTSLHTKKGTVFPKVARCSIGDVPWQSLEALMMLHAWPIYDAKKANVLQEIHAVVNFKNGVILGVGCLPFCKMGCQAALLPRQLAW